MIWSNGIRHAFIKECLSCKIYAHAFQSLKSIFFCRFPSHQVQADSLLNQGPRTIFFALKKDVAPSCALDQIIHILDTEPTQTLIKIERTEEYLISGLKNSVLIKDRVMTQFWLATINNR